MKKRKKRKKLTKDDFIGPLGALTGLRYPFLDGLLTLAFVLYMVKYGFAELGTFFDYISNALNQFWLNWD